MHITHTINRSDLPEDCIAECSGRGDVSEAVAIWREKLNLTVDQPIARRCLRATGAWSWGEIEALSDDDVAEKILWMACCSFRGDDFFAVE